MLMIIHGRDRRPSMSTLKTNTLTGTTSAGSIVVTGEGGSTTTNLQQGLAKWWITLDGVGTAEARDSFNNSSITDEGTGKYTFTINNDMSNTNYNITSNGSSAASDNYGFNFFAKHSDGIATCTLQMWNANPGNLASYADGDYLYATIHGALA